MATYLCKTNEIADPGSMGFDVALENEQLMIFVVHKDGQFYGYRNNCPHTHVNLEWLPNQFLDMDKTFIHCSGHGALFRIEDGRCISGPCINESLQQIRVYVDGGVLYTRV